MGKSVGKIRLLGILIALFVVGCSSPKMPPSPSSPSATPPSASPPSASPPSPPSQSPSSSSSPPSPPSAQPPQASLPSPSLPSPSTPSPSTPSSQPPDTSSSSSKSSDKSDSKSASKDQQQAAQDLKKAGERIAQSGQEMKEAGGQASDLPQDPLMSQKQGSDESDPLIPESDNASNSDSDIYADSGGEPSAGNEPSANGEPSAEDQLMAGESGGLGSLDDEIRAAQEALEEAGVALQTAGDLLENASTDEEMAAAGEALANARISIIVAGQGLIDAGDEMSDNPAMEGIYSEAEDALNDANVAIVIATNTLLSSRIDLPQPGGSSDKEGRMGELDRELEDSMGVFENEILEARRSVIDSTPPPTSNEAIPGPVVMGGSGSVGEDEPGEDPGMTQSDDIQQGRMEEGDIAVATTQVSKPPDDIPDAQGDDIVAQQLREAAASETDPELQAKLWEEYKRYKAGI